jgi:hypothetical protein
MFGLAYFVLKKIQHKIIEIYSRKLVISPIIIIARQANSISVYLGKFGRDEESRVSFVN